MTIAEVRARAKTLVLSVGPDAVFEFGEEVVRDRYGWECNDAQLQWIEQEATKQASRVYRLLGYTRSGMVE